MIPISGLDHIVLNVADIDRSLAFYRDLLGLQPERLEEFRAGQVPFPSVRISAGTIIDLFPAQPAGPSTEAHRNNLNHLCLVTDADDIDAVRDELAAAGFPSQDEPKTRWGARGNARAIYVTDPDGNTVEIRTYHDR